MGQALPQRGQGFKGSGVRVKYQELQRLESLDPLLQLNRRRILFKKKIMPGHYICCPDLILCE